MKNTIFTILCGAVSLLTFAVVYLAVKMQETQKQIKALRRTVVAQVAEVTEFKRFKREYEDEVIPTLECLLEGQFMLKISAGLESPYGDKYAACKAN